MVKSGKVAFSETLLAKLLPLAIVIPLFLRIQNFDGFEFIRIQFDIEQGAYILATGIIVVISFIEFRITQGNARGFASLNLGSGLALVIVLIGIGFLIWILVFGINDFSTQNTFNDYFTFYMGFSILIISIQAIREITGKKRRLVSEGVF